MRLAQGRAGWALLAAGTVGLAVTAAVQVSSSSAPAAPAKSAATPAPVDGAARLTEIRVELAWLADPTTFPYEVAAHVDGSRLEVGGIVPNDALRQRALQVAKAQCSLQVVDKLILLPSAAVESVHDKNDNLCRTASLALTKTFNRFPGNFQVDADPHGVVTVAGEVPTCEDKLTVSRRLAQLTGCTSVVNHLTVARVVRDGKPFTPISADGKVVLPGEPKDLLRTQPAEAVAVKPTPSPKPTLAVATKPTTPPVAAKPTTTAVTTPVATRPTPLPVTTPVATRPTTSTATAVVVTPTTSPATAPVATTPAPTAPKPTTVAAAPVPPAKLPPSVLGSSDVLQAPASAVARPTNNNNGIVLASATQPAAPATTAPRTPTTGPAKPVAVADAPAKAAPSKPATAAAVTKPATAPTVSPEVVAQVKQRIERSCGSKVRDLTVTASGKNQLDLHFCVKTESDGQLLGVQVLKMPELAPYKVELKVEVK